ncbi:MAG: hypothetical protein D6761_10620 [Candidatus Dadabacteria bacterium]|nr:MAG: hypothetical protein D6761_10620 [Candidatus Dadabacteria bacterium]
MMRVHISLIAVLGLLAGCGYPKASSLGLLEPGMAPAAVRQVLGAPTWAAGGGQEQRYVYRMVDAQGRKRFRRICGTLGAVSLGVACLPWAYRDALPRDYELRFVDGRLAAWGPAGSVPLTR